eukprot:447554_1
MHSNLPSFRPTMHSNIQINHIHSIPWELKQASSLCRVFKFEMQKGTIFFVYLNQQDWGILARAKRSKIYQLLTDLWKTTVGSVLKGQNTLISVAMFTKKKRFEANHIKDNTTTIYVFKDNNKYDHVGEIECATHSILNLSDLISESLVISNSKYYQLLASGYLTKQENQIKTFKLPDVLKQIILNYIDPLFFSNCE